MKSNHRRDNYINTSKFTLQNIIGSESEDSTREMGRKLRANKKMLQSTSYLEEDKRVVSNQIIQDINEHRAKINENKRNNDDNFTQTMYNITSMQYKSNRRFTSCIPQKISRNNQLLSTRNFIQDTKKLMTRFTVTASLAVAIFFILCITAGASSTSGSETAASSSAPSTLNQNSQQNSIERLSSEKDHQAAAASISQSTPQSSSSQTSIVASLSSAVASAAAAAAVAAAKDTLSSNDARSLLSSSSSTGSNVNQNHAQQSRSPGLHLALKIADAIPEVPYNILHNMKKLDHAAPFYNVPNKVTSGGSVKESSHNLLSSALSASSGLGGAADNLSSLFKSPLWKRIADGYGEFTSEFRSLFNQWQPATYPVGRPQKSATKLLRDISVPALLMLFASTFPTDWRPTKTRRKLSVPSDLSQSASAAISALDPMTATSPELPNYPLSPQMFRSGFNMPTFHSQNRGSFNSMNDLEQSKTTSSQLDRIVNSNDINLQPQSAQDVLSGSINWMPATSQPAPMSQNHYESFPMQQQQQQQQQQVAQQQQPQQLSIRRIGEFNTASSITSNDSKYSQRDIKPVKSDRTYSSAPAAASSTNQATQNVATSGGLFSSLTSSLANVKNSKLMNRIMNANGNENQQTSSNSFKMMSLGDVSDGQKFSSFLRPNRNHFNDKHRYSLVAPDDNESTHFNNLNEQQSEKLSPSSKPFFLSAMTHAITSMFDSPLAESGSSLSGSNKHNVATPTTSSLDNGEQQHSIISDKTLSRRQQQASNAEQRDLSLLLPQSWKEVVKRTVNNVKQEASTQWRSIEGQLTNWVQDKLKTLPVPSTSSSSGSSSSSSVVAAPVANIIASVSSTAMNILGLSNNKNPSSSSSSITHSATTSSSNSNDPAQTNGSQSPTSNESSGSGGGSSSQRGGKHDSSPNKNSGSGKGGGALAGVANMIVNTLTSRTSSPASSHFSSTPSSSKIADDSGSVISQYPTLTGAQPSQASVSSMASGTASTVAAMSTMMNN